MSDDGPIGIELTFDELLVDGVTIGELASSGLVRVELATSEHERGDELAVGEVSNGELAWGKLLWCGLAVDGATSSLLMCLHGWSLLLVSSLL